MRQVRSRATPAVTVLMPFRDEERFLAQSIRSILDQTQRNWELVALDDHSTDRSVSILRDAAESDSRIRILTSRGRGLVDALNHGFAVAKAPLIARMDADDVMMPDRLEVQYRMLEDDPRLMVVGSRVRIFPRAGLGNGYREYERWLNGILTPDDIALEIYQESPLPHPSVMFRLAEIRDAGGYSAGRFAEDYELWLRLHARGARMAKSPRVLIAWRERPDRTSRIDPRYDREAFDRLRACYLALDSRLSSDRPLVIWGAGRRTRQRARHLLDRGVQIEGWIDIDPRKIGRQAGGLPVRPPDWLSAADPKPFILCYVRNYGARDSIAARLETMRYQPGTDWLPVG